jgi:hypothetical protein
MDLNECEIVASHRSPETWSWLQEHWEEVLTPVPQGTRWALLSNDGHRLLGYGDDADQLRRTAAELGEWNAITAAVSDRSDQVYI